MSNIQTVMCRDNNCPRGPECYRYRAIPVTAPRIQEYRKFKRASGGCSGFIGLHGRTDITGGKS